MCTDQVFVTPPLYSIPMGQIPISKHRCETKDVLKHIVNQVEEIRETHSGPITVIWPTNTASVYMKRQYELSQNGTLGVRFSTLNDVLSLLQDAQQETHLLPTNDNLVHFDKCYAIAREMFPLASAWIKAPLISSTLELLYSMSDERQSQALHDYELVEKCWNLYKRGEEKSVAKDIKSAPLIDIVGVCILISHDELSYAQKRFVDNYGDIIHSTIIETDSAQVFDIEVFSTPFEEIDSVLTQFLAKDTEAFTATALLVPDNNYKRYLIETARRKGIPLAGTSPYSIAIHPFIRLATYFLKEHGLRPPEIAISHFKNEFGWIKDSFSTNLVFETFKAINASLTAGDRFKAIVNFINSEVNTDYFDDGIVEESQTKLAINLLNDLSSSISPLSKNETLLLLEQQSKKHMLRIGSVGTGLFVATPNEIYSATFQNLYVLGMKDNYITAPSVASSLVPKDQYELYDLEGKLAKEKQVSSISSWLRNCSENIRLTSSAVDAKGKQIVLPYWAIETTNNNHSSYLSDMKWDESTLIRSTHLAKQISHSLNDVNALAQIDDSISVSATGVEEMARCPYYFFNTRILRANSEIINEDPDDLLPIVLGSFIHKQLESYVTKKLNREILDALVKEYIDDLAEKKQLPHSAARILTLEKISLLIDNFLELHEKTESDAIEVEKQIQGELELGDISIEAKGTIDRVHTDRGKRVIVDYKTAKAKSSVDTFVFGRKIQLAIYALLCGENIDALEYWHLGGTSGEVISTNWNEENKAEALNIIEVINETIKSGYFLPRESFVTQEKNSAKYETYCSTCEVEPFCYEETRLLWPSKKYDNALKGYSKVTGELLLEGNEVSS